MWLPICSHTARFVGQVANHVHHRQRVREQHAAARRAAAAGVVGAGVQRLEVGGGEELGEGVAVRHARVVQRRRPAVAHGSASSNRDLNAGSRAQL